MQCYLQDFALTFTEPTFIRDIQVAVTAEGHAGGEIQSAHHGLLAAEQVNAHDVAGPRR